MPFVSWSRFTDILTYKDQVLLVVYLVVLLVYPVVLLVYLVLLWYLD